jgi:hypothetical protein
VTKLTIYSKSGCHLCDDMKAVARHVARLVPLTIDDIDISGHPELEARYGLEIPVLLVDGVKAAKYRITESELLRVVEGRSSDERG